jgi:HPr kinase/phosphorylase
MEQSLTTQALFDEVSGHIRIEWLAGQKGRERQLHPPHRDSGSASLLGHLNLIHPNQVQVLGPTECDYLSRLRKNSRTDAYEQIFSKNTQAIIVAEDLKIPKGFRQMADDRQVPLWRTPSSSYDALSILRYVFTNRLAKKTVTHGVFLEVLGIGLMITGESRVGKSELALELISRGHRLIADDTPQFSRIAPDILNGTSPPILQDLLEVRGLGILNIRSMYGDNAIKTNKYLRLIIHLSDFDESYQAKEDRLTGTTSTTDILGLKVPVIHLPVAPGRNLAVLVEAAVRNHMLRIKGYNAAEDLIQRQQRQIEIQSS